MFVPQRDCFVFFRCLGMGLASSGPSGPSWASLMTDLKRALRRVSSARCTPPTGSGWNALSACAPKSLMWVMIDFCLFNLFLAQEMSHYCILNFAGWGVQGWGPQRDRGTVWSGRCRETCSLLCHVCPVSTKQLLCTTNVYVCDTNVRLFLRMCLFADGWWSLTVMGIPSW